MGEFLKNHNYASPQQTPYTSVLQNMSIFPSFQLRFFFPFHPLKAIGQLRWLNTVFDTSAPFTFFSKTLDPLATKNGREQVNTNVSFLIVELTYLPCQWQHD